MEIDLAGLCEMHPRLPVDLALSIVGRAALALERNGHAPGVRFSLDVERVEMEALLSWPPAVLGEIEQHDQNQITEDGAEAVALATVHQQKAWRVVRRMQKGEHADWLLEEPVEEPGTGGFRIALEISGVNLGSIEARLSDKLEQVAKADVKQRWASVVGFEKPAAALRRAKRGKRGG